MLGGFVVNCRVVKKCKTKRKRIILCSAILFSKKIEISIYLSHFTSEFISTESKSASNTIRWMNDVVQNKSKIIITQSSFSCLNVVFRPIIYNNKL